MTIIISDGGDATQQSSTKVDLKITYDGEATRLLSLKAGSVKQFGQGSGGGWTQVSDFFDSVLKFKLPWPPWYFFKRFKINITSVFE